MIDLVAGAQDGVVEVVAVDLVLAAPSGQADQRGVLGQRRAPLLTRSPLMSWKSVASALDWFQAVVGAAPRSAAPSKQRRSGEGHGARHDAAGRTASTAGTWDEPTDEVMDGL